MAKTKCLDCGVDVLGGYIRCPECRRKRKLAQYAAYRAEVREVKRVARHVRMTEEDVAHMT